MIEFIKKIENAVDVIVHALEKGNKVLFCGNGGSAADAQHLAAEFSGRFYLNRKACPLKPCIVIHLI
jgi:D-sedoheptulose 7-phosphate isomerase